MSKKVIEQKGLPNISVHKLEYLTVLVQDGKAPVDIHKSNATTVAKAICLEYQKVIDQNAKLVEALEIISEYGSTGEDAVDMKRIANQALQNTKKIEG